MTQIWPDLNSRTQAASRLALMIDGDNIAPDLLPAVQAIIAQAGKAMIRRVYCDTAHLAGWAGLPGFRVIHSGAGKNATDMLLIVEAMALAYQGATDGFVIASSDRDFAHLAHHLREKGHRVIGVGEGKTPSSFRAACSVFHFLTEPRAPVEPTGDVKPITPAVPIARTLSKSLADHVKDIIKEDESPKGVLIAMLNSQMRQRRQGFCIAKHPDKSWRTYLTAHPTLYACDPRGPQARVRWIGG